MSESTPQSENPLASSIETIRSELDRWLEIGRTQGGRALDAIGLRPCDKKWSPLVDVVESPEAVVVCADVPGVDPEAIKVELIGNMLTLRGKRPAFDLGDGQTVHVGERASGEFCRSIPMPVPVDSDTVAADIRDGVLTIRLPKSESAKAKEIPIGHGPAGD